MSNSILYFATYQLIVICSLSLWVEFYKIPRYPPSPLPTPHVSKYTYYGVLTYMYVATLDMYL